MAHVTSLSQNLSSTEEADGGYANCNVLVAVAEYYVLLSRPGRFKRYVEVLAITANWLWCVMLEE